MGCIEFRDSRIWKRAGRCFCPGVDIARREETIDRAGGCDSSLSLSAVVERTRFRVLGRGSSRMMRRLLCGAGLRKGDRLMSDSSNGFDRLEADVLAGRLDRRQVGRCSV